MANTIATTDTGKAVEWDVMGVDLMITSAF